MSPLPPSSFRRRGTVLLVLALAAALGGCSSATTSGTAGPTPSPSGPTSASGSQSGSGAALPPITPLDPPGAVRQDVTGAPDWLAFASGSAWTAAAGGLTRLDARTAKPVGSVAIPGSICLAMDVGYASIWVATCDTPTLVRVEPVRSRITASITLPINGVHEESSVAAGSGTFGVWVLSADGRTIVHVDPATNTVAGTMGVPAGSTAVRAGFGSLWITDSTDGTLLRIDPRGGKVIATIPVGAGPRFLTVGDTGVYTLNQGDGSVSHVDPVTNTLVATVKVDDSPIDGGDIAWGGGYVWARVTGSLVSKVDPRTDTVVERLGTSSGSGGVAFGDRALFISAHDVNSVWRVGTG